MTMILTDPIANMERIHKENFAYQMLLRVRGIEQNGNIENVALNQQDIKILKSELNLEISRK